MNEQDQKNQKQDPPKNNLGGRNSAPSSSYKKTLSRKWISPALFVAAAAIIVTVMWLYQGNDKKTSTTVTPPDTTQVTDQGGDKQPTQETIQPVKGEAAKWPVATTDVKVQRGYFDATAPEADQEAAIVEQGDNTFQANTGIDLARSDNQPFDVLAMLSGKVTLVQDQPTNGTVVEITHGNGVVSVYQSLSGVSVKEGDDVKQGTVIGKAGQNELQKDLGVHLHFAVLKNDEHVNPNSVLPALAPAANAPSAADSSEEDAE